VWKIPAAGGSPVQVTRDGGFIAFESPDGALLYYSKGRDQPELWKKALPAGEEVPVLPDFAWASYGPWRVTSQGVCFLDRDTKAGSRSPVLKLLPHAGGAAKVLATLEGAAYPLGVSGVTSWHPLTISPDGKYLLITQLDQRQSNIMIAEGFR
jgi:hypothetical protein